MKTDFKDGQIAIDSDIGNQFGFTSDKFEGWLWKEGNEIVISMIISKQPGKRQFSKLLNKIMGFGFNIIVATPMGLMPAILKHKGFIKATRTNELFGIVDIMEYKNPKNIP